MEDGFIRQKLAEAALKPTPPAESVVLLRRLYFGLIGLPPSGGFIAKWMLLQAAIGSGEWGWATLILAGSLLAGDGGRRHPRAPR